MPETVAFATKGELAKRMLARAFAAQVPAAWVVGDTIYGGDDLRRWLEAQGRPYVLAVPCTHGLWTAGQQVEAQALVAGVPDAAWARLSAGEGSQGPRWYDWALPGAALRCAAGDGALAARPAWDRRPERARILPDLRAGGDDAGGAGAGGGAPLVHRDGVRGGERVGGVGPVRGAQMGGMAPAHHPGAARARRAGRDAGAGSGGRKGGGMRVALTVPETRRLLSLAGGDAEQHQHHLRWSQWRRTHQATAKRCHTARRARRQPPLIHRQGHVIRVAGTPTLTEELWARLAPLLSPSHGQPRTPARRASPDPRGIAVDDACGGGVARDPNGVRRLADTVQPVSVVVPGWDMGTDCRGITVHRGMSRNCRCSTTVCLKT